MIATTRDVQVLTRADFERLPDEGRWEVVEGSAVLMPPPEFEHQQIGDNLVRLFHARLQAAGSGCVVSAVSVFIPRPPGAFGVQSRTPDVIVSRQTPSRYFEAGEPPDLVIEILSTPRGNVERTEKVDDYARAGITEYWIVDPFQRAVEVYRKAAGGEYAAPQIMSSGPLTPRPFPGVAIDIHEIWPK